MNAPDRFELFILPDGLEKYDSRNFRDDLDVVYTNYILG